MKRTISTIFIPHLPSLKIARSPSKKQRAPRAPNKPKPAAPPQPKPRPPPSKEMMLALSAFHTQVEQPPPPLTRQVKEASPRPPPPLHQLVAQNTVDRAFDLLRQHMRRRFELWVPNLTGELTCINPRVARGEHLVLDPPQRVGETQLLTVGINTAVSAAAA